MNNHDLRILRVDGVTDLSSKPPLKLPPDQSLPDVDEARCQRREEANIKAAQASAGERRSLPRFYTAQNLIPCTRTDRSSHGLTPSAPSERRNP